MDINNKIKLGDLGEKIAEEYLGKKGYTILKKNFRSEFGEIDIIAADKEWTIFVEVKTRTGARYGSPEESIYFNKVDRIRKAALAFLKDSKTGEKKSIRFDVISIKLDKDRLLRTFYRDPGILKLAGKYKIFSSIEHITDAF